MPQVGVRWPDHWYHDQDHIHCIVPGCDFVVPNPLLSKQWAEILDHCMNTVGTEHHILTKMLKQGLCAVDGCDHASFQHGASHHSTRALFAHEKVAHGSTKMSDICSYVTLAREGRVCGGVGGQNTPNEEIEKLAFQRMLEKVLALPNRTIALLFQKNDLHHPNTQKRAEFNENLVWILTADYLAQHGENPPYWWPIRAEHFLWLCRPDPTEPANGEWRMMWNNLRNAYARGQI